jgi:hypothetical protein
MATPEYQNYRIIAGSMPQKQTEEERHASSDGFFAAMQAAAATLIDTRDALATALRAPAQPPDFPALMLEAVQQEIDAAQNELSEAIGTAQREAALQEIKGAMHKIMKAISPIYFSSWKRKPALELSDCFFAGANLSYAMLHGANLREVPLQGANLYMAQLKGAILNQARLAGASLQYARLQGADLSYAMLQGSNLYHAMLQGTIVAEANIDEVAYVPETIVEADFKYSYSNIWDTKLLIQLKKKYPQYDWSKVKIPKEELESLP